MTLSLPERLAMLMPPSIFYRRRIAQEARTGEPELAVLGGETGSDNILIVPMLDSQLLAADHVRGNERASVSS